MVQPNLRKYQILTWVKRMNDGWGTYGRMMGENIDKPPTITNITAHIVYNGGFKDIVSEDLRREKRFVEAKSNVSRYVNKYVQDYLLEYSITKIEKGEYNHLDVKEGWNTGGREVKKLELTEGENCGGVNKRKYLIKEMKDRNRIGEELNKLAGLDYLDRKRKSEKSKNRLKQERGETTQRRFTDIIRNLDWEEFDGVKTEEIVLPKVKSDMGTKTVRVHDIDSVEGY